MDRTSPATMPALEKSDCGCGCSGNSCGCMPAEFTRLRYAYGLRLGAVELNDEQSYLVGKHRLHNARCHGSGVLCGLRVDRFLWPQGSPPQTASTVLRVSRGAAIDQCGREILVACGQCIDVAAWFAKHRAQIDLTGVTNNTLPLQVALRYRECPSDPALVPRDPCGCDTGGCDYTRVREGFELALFAAPPPCAGDVFPSADSLLAALNGNASAPANLETALDELLAEGCPHISQEQWICLAGFNATLSQLNPTTLVVADISPPDDTISGRRPLLSTAALQSILLGVVGAASAEGLLGTGPSLGEAAFQGSGATSGTLSLPILLVTDANQTTGTLLAADTFDPSSLQVHQFNGTKWVDVTPTTGGNIQYDGTEHITVTWGAGDPPLAAGNYRLALVSPDATPIVDRRMRPLRPLRFTRDFGLTVASGVLTLAPVSF